VETILSNVTANVNDDGKLCSICLCVPTAKEKYIFELCGHPTCKPCLQGQIKSGELPLKCSKEGCGTEICIPDLEAALGGNGSEWKAFLRRAVTDFLSKSEKFANCPEPDCLGFVPKKNSDKNRNQLLFYCYECGQDICIV
jgi:hypothetical protein